MTAQHCSHVPTSRTTQSSVSSNLTPLMLLCGLASKLLCSALAWLQAAASSPASTARWRESAWAGPTSLCPQSGLGKLGHSRHAVSGGNIERHLHLAFLISQPTPAPKIHTLHPQNHYLTALHFLFFLAESSNLLEKNFPQRVISGCREGTNRARWNLPWGNPLMTAEPARL